MRYGMGCYFVDCSFASPPRSSPPIFGLSVCRAARSLPEHRLLSIIWELLRGTGEASREGFGILQLICASAPCDAKQSGRPWPCGCSAGHGNEQIGTTQRFRKVNDFRCAMEAKRADHVGTKDFCRRRWAVYCTAYHCRQPRCLA